MLPMAKSKRKPLSFNTTLRNPERIAGFLSVLSKYENKILTDEVIKDICCEIISKKLYKPTAISKNEEWKNIYQSEELTFDKKTAYEIMLNAPQNHKEHGFSKGWSSRFDTWYKLIMEFGFCFYEMNQAIEISKIGKLLIDEYDKEIKNNLLIQNIFLNAMAKFQTHTPFRKNLNANVPLLLLLKVISLLKKQDTNATGIHRKEVAFFLCWHNNNEQELYDYIIEFRKKYQFQASNEIIYEHCLKMFSDNIDSLKGYIKSDRLFIEATDEYIRKMRITGVISLRGNGRFIDFNTLEIEKINYLIKNYGECVYFEDKKEYYNYVKLEDKFILSIKQEKTIDHLELKQSTLKKYAQLYDDEKLKSELLHTYKGTTNDELLKFIDAPVRLEFLTVIAIVKYFNEINVIPYYSIDDEGLPKFTAKGGVADIECFQQNCCGLVEVTLMTGIAQQTEHEMTSISDHLKSAIEKYPNKNTLALFIAPVLQNRALTFMRWLNSDELNQRNSLGIIPLKISEIIDCFKSVENLDEFIKFR